jgi:glycosyltransferase involved in cell wall biosynthesis
VLIALENEPYPYDRRVRQEAEALVAAGYELTVCGPTGFGHDASEEEVDGVRVLRYPAPPHGSGVISYLREYGVSLFRLARLMRRAHRRQHVDVIFVCSPPDLLMLPAIPLRTVGAAVVFDHHDLSPELLEAKFGPRPLLSALVRRAERLALRQADAVIATNDTYAEIERTRGGIAADRIFVVRNGPDPARIHPVAPQPQLRRGHAHLVCWVGLMSSQEGLHYLLDAAERIVRHEGRRDVVFALVGGGNAREELMADVRRRGLEGVIDFPGHVRDDLLRDYMATADVCVSVDEPNPMNDASTMTKVVEYMVMGRPIVQFRLRETSRVCGEACLYARSGDSGDLARRITELLNDPQAAARLGTAARDRAVPDLLWPLQVPALLDAVAAALRRRGRIAPPVGGN